MVRRLLHPATVISLIALVFALGGTSYAVTQLSAGSVGTAQLRNGAVTNQKLARASVGSLKLRTGAVTRAKIARGAVNGSKLADGAVTSRSIFNGTIQSWDLGWTVWRDLTGARGPEGPAGPTGATGPQGPQGPAGPVANRAYASFYSTATQVLSGVAPNDNPAAVVLSVADPWNTGVSIGPGGESLCVDTAGVYNYQFSMQVTKSGSGTDYVDIWPMLGTDDAGFVNVPWSNTELALTAGERVVAAWNFLFELEAGECMRLMAYSSDGTAQIVARLAQAGPPAIPAVPPTIVTVRQVG